MSPAAGARILMRRMARAKDKFVTAALELARAVDRAAGLLREVSRLLDGTPSQLMKPPFRTTADGRVYVPGEPGGWIPTGPGPIIAARLQNFPATDTDPDSRDFGMPLFSAHATRLKLAEELLDGIRSQPDLHAEIKQYPGRPLSAAASKKKLRHANLFEELPRVIDGNFKLLDDDEVFSLLRESLLCRAKSFIGVTPSREDRRALDRLAPGRMTRNFRPKRGGPDGNGSSANLWLARAHAAAVVLKLYDAGAPAFARAYRERAKNPP